MYDFKKIEAKWQKKWEEKKVFEANEDSKKKKFYCLEMYPYPSGTGLHMGHAFNYTIGDIRARFKRMQGFNVLHPMGYDSFGLPAENAAIKANSHPRKFTDAAIENFIRQQKSLGLSYDWSRKIQSHDENYYKWNQWIFLKMFEKGLAYRKKAAVNFCPKCDTVLANEQVHNGKCWRHLDTEIEIKNLEQWFIKTSAYAEEILEEIDKLDWPERIKTMQRNWIGKSEGAEIIFEINGEKFKVFTTRADTLFGVTFLVISAQHSELMKIVAKEKKGEVEKFLKKIKSTKEEDLDKMEKEGVFTGAYAIHPMTKEKIPVWTGNFVIAEYGSGIVMGVPAHDQRDFEFAKKYKLPIKVVIKPVESMSNVELLSKDKNEQNFILTKGTHAIYFNDEQKIFWDKTRKDILLGNMVYVGSGNLINSQDFDGLFSEEAKEHIVKFLESKKLGKKSVQYKLRDWLVSRQRYWGTPIPILYDENGKPVPVDENELPVKLPEDVFFGKGNPIATSKKFASVKIKGKNYRRETDTMDTFFDSSWYYFRFTDSKNAKKPFDSKNAKYWMPVDFYTGGAEHACMHLIYARFFTKVLRDFGMIDKNLSEPFKRLFNQGMVHGEDGFVMSKSRGNVVDPTKTIEKFGADALRMFSVSMASPDSDYSWNTTGLESIYKFVLKTFEYFSKTKPIKSDEKMQSKVNKAIKEITEDIENLRYNLAVIKLRALFLYLDGKSISKRDLESCVKIISPFCPHIAEEIWEKLGNKNFISLSEWPKCDEKKINEEFEKQEQQAEKLIDDINKVANLLMEREKKKVSKVFIYVLPKEKQAYSEQIGAIKSKTGLDAKIYSVSDKDKRDPENKSKNVKPGRPGIFLE